MPTTPEQDAQLTASMEAEFAKPPAVLEQPASPPPDILQQAEQTAAAMKQAASYMMEEAHEINADIIERAERMVMDAKQSVEKIRTYSERMRTLGGKLVDAHDEFHNLNGKGDDLSGQ